MIIVTRMDIPEHELGTICERVESLGLAAHVLRGIERTVVACVGDDARLADIPLLALPGIESVTPVLRPFKLASREAAAGRPAPIRVSGVTFGGQEIPVIAGPCSVENRDMLLESARRVGSAGATMLRGGAYKPRTSPYAFQGLGAEALEYLVEARHQTGLPFVTEVMDTRQVGLIADRADMLQIGARNMQNYALLAEVGRTETPVLLKRGLAANVTELLMAAEYIMSHGNSQVVLCERGIRTFESATRNTLDVGIIPVLKRETHLPVIVDPSHAAGRADLVRPLAAAALAAGADGLIIETHPDPARALSDGDQSVPLHEFAALMDRLRPFAQAAGRTFGSRPGTERPARVAVA